MEEERLQEKLSEREEKERGTLAFLRSFLLLSCLGTNNTPEG
jgi:hypothetical protein